MGSDHSCCNNNKDENPKTDFKVPENKKESAVKSCKPVFNPNSLPQVPIFNNIPSSFEFLWSSDFYVLLLSKWKPLDIIQKTIHKLSILDWLCLISKWIDWIGISDDKNVVIKNIKSKITLCTKAIMKQINEMISNKPEAIKGDCQGIYSRIFMAVSEWAIIVQYIKYINQSGIDEKYNQNYFEETTHLGKDGNCKIVYGVFKWVYCLILVKYQINGSGATCKSKDDHVEMYVDVVDKFLNNVWEGVEMK